MAAANTDLLRKVAPNTGWQLDSSGIIDASVDHFGLVNAAGLPTGTAVLITVDRVNSNGAKTPAFMERIIGVVSGTNIVSCIRGVEGTAQQHAGGAKVEILFSAKSFNDYVDAMLVEHNQDGSHKQPATAKTSVVDADAMGLFDSAASFVGKYITFAILKLAIYAGIKPPQGTMWNGKIVPSVASNNLTVALKTKSGGDPSATDPVYIMIGDTLRTVTAALSVTKNAATNWCNAGSTDLATKEIDYFVYLGYNATDGVVIGFSRIPYANQYSDFSVTTTNEKYCAISTITTAASTDYYENIGRFAATLSAGAGYTWTVPTFTASNLIQRPIYETRWLSYVATYVGSGSMTYTSVSENRYVYKIIGKNCNIFLSSTGTIGGTLSYGIYVSHPFTALNYPWSGSGNALNSSGYALAWDTGGTPKSIYWRKYDGGNFTSGAVGIHGQIEYEI